VVSCILVHLGVFCVDIWMMYRVTTYRLDFPSLLEAQKFHHTSIKV